MKSLAAVLVLCSLTAACSGEDTQTPTVWRQTDEPRLSAFDRHNAAEPDCRDYIATADDARKLLMTAPGCTEKVIAALEDIVLTDRRARNDLAAAYYLSARQEHRAPDLLRALEAVQGAPASREARFNRALIEEALGLRDAAIADWDASAKDDAPQWSNVARRHRDALKAKVSGPEAWKRTEGKLEKALAARDSAKVARLIQPFYDSATGFLFGKLTAGRTSDAKLLAGVLASYGGDRFAVDLVNSWPRQTEDSPLSLAMQSKEASGVFNSQDPKAFARADDLLRQIAPPARRAGYRHLNAKIQVFQSQIAMYQGRFVDALADIDAAIDEYRRLDDPEDLADAEMRKIGILRKAGAKELAFQQALRAVSLSDHLSQERNIHSLWGEPAATALELGFPHAALLYQECAVRVATQSRPTALRQRAEIEIRLNDLAAAKADLDQAAKDGDLGPDAHRILQARLEIVLGQAAVRLRQPQAIAHFTKAFSWTNAENHTARADILRQRGDAYRKLAKPFEANADFERAIAEIALEEKRMLDGRQPGRGEELWSGYFSRFQDTYRSIIRYLLERRRYDEAFEYTERARAAEPINLATHNSEPVHVRPKDVQAQLLPGWFLVEYVLMDDDAFAWVLSRDRVDFVPLAVGRAAMERWRRQVQRGARFNDLTAFQAPLAAAYPALIAPVLQKIGPGLQRLVIIPDGPMHGLPLPALYDSSDARPQYLIERAPIETDGSAALYLLSLERDRQLAASPNHSVLLVGDPTFDKSLEQATDLDDLPSARMEVKREADIYGRSAQQLIGENATPERVFDMARRSAVVEIAGHSIPDADAPFRSVILLAKSAQERGAVYPPDLLKRFQKAETRLMILASCSSGGGLPVGAEGLAPLVRPIVAAGVPAVIGSLWPVNDDTTLSFFVSFHRHFKAGQDAAVALQEAQIEMLRKDNSLLRQAMAWGAFQVIGHSASPFAPAPRHKEKP